MAAIVHSGLCKDTTSDDKFYGHAALQSANLAYELLPGWLSHNDGAAGEAEEAAEQVFMGEMASCRAGAFHGMTRSPRCRPGMVAVSPQAPSDMISSAVRCELKRPVQPAGDCGHEGSRTTGREVPPGQPDAARRKSTQSIPFDEYYARRREDWLEMEGQLGDPDLLAFHEVHSPREPETIKFAFARRMRPSIGLHLDLLDGRAAFIDIILPGLIEDRLTTHPGRPNLQVNDRIVSVNSVSVARQGARSAGERLLKEMRETSVWNIVLERPVEVRADVSLDGKELGIQVRSSALGSNLLLTGVSDGGAFADWNKAVVDHRIVAGDRIVEVNGVRGVSKQLLEQVAKGSNYSFVFLHYDALP